MLAMKGYERGVDEDASGRAWANNPNFIRADNADNIEQAVLLVL